jgi:hypothetical protein
VIMIVVRLYQRDKYYQSDRINPFNRCVDLSPKFRQRIRNTIFSEWRLVSWDRWDGSFTREFKGAAVRRLELG